MANDRRQLLSVSQVLHDYKIHLHSNLLQCSTINHPTDVLSDYPVVLRGSSNPTHCDCHPAVTTASLDPL